MSSTVTRTPRGTARWSPADRAAWALVAVVLLAIFVAYARARWPGFLPVGSDNDEYQLAGRALASFDAPLIAGVEGTKYPLGYPAVLALLQWLGLAVPPAALVVNLVALAATVGIVAAVAGRATPARPGNPGAGLAAGAVVVTSVSVWNDAYSVMPELFLLLVFTVMLATLQTHPDHRRLGLLTALAVAAVLLKTLAALLVVGGVGLLWLSANRRRTPDGGHAPASHGVARHAVLVPAVAAVVTVLAGMAAVRGLPAHTTGYLATFTLRDPFDASQGRLGAAGLVRRAVADVPATLTDLGRAVALIDAGTAVAVTVAVVALTLGVLAAFRLHPAMPLGPFAAGATLAYVVGLAAWPYHSSRFGIPLVPVAALGAGWLVRLVSDARVPAGAGPTGAPDGAHDAGGTDRGLRGDGQRALRRPVVATVAGAALTVALVATSWPAVVQRGDAAAQRLAVQHAALEELERFAADHLDDDQQLVSFDYREVANRLGRPVAPLRYTSDTEALSEQVGDADLVVMVDIHHVRNRQLGLLLAAEPDRFSPLLERDAVAVYRVDD